MNQKRAIKSFALALAVQEPENRHKADMLLFTAATYLVNQPGRAANLSKYGLAEYHAAIRYLAA